MTETEYDVIISDAALSMLDSHIDFLARVSPSAATKLMDKILDDIGSLSKNPQRFPFYENEFISSVRYRRMLTSKRYLVLYEIDGITVNVDYIVDCRQDYEWLIR
ncbi:MAG: type II toxin-antitoxin system RelE/ParE family toxin [Peptococcaceae bacterium]|jgi:plasmid stabilization system protein ParE|nr:type II toxin-antitoxin system RelE/ParE family toxin [Peptococcaceae bacterium]